jgi:hypothetical protein
VCSSWREKEKKQRVGNEIKPRNDEASRSVEQKSGAAAGDWLANDPELMLLLLDER